MTDTERDYMAQSIRAAVAESIAPLAQRVAVLETRSKAASWLGAALVSPAIAALVAWIVTALSHKAGN